MSFYNSGGFQWRFDNQENQMFGLINQGATCYLNSVLQVLFRTRGFRDVVNRSRTCSSDHNDLVLKALFEDLNRQTADTVQVTNMLGIDRVNQQRDAAEYLEKILTQCSEEASQVFQGKMTNRTVCRDCDDKIDEETEFLNLPLALVKSHGKHYSVVDGIQEFFKESLLDEDNQLYCEKCDCKSDAVSTCLITRHPEVLMLLLKRFEFNYNYMAYVKNDRLVDVPHTITIPENQIYEIYAFVEHFGSLRGGHYTATIRCPDGKEGRWFCFDDSSVTLLQHQPFQDHQTIKSQSAYLLFYKRKTHAAGGGFHDNRDVSKSRGVLHDANRNPAHSQNADNKQDEEDEVERDEEVRTDTSSDAKPRRPESGLSVEAGQNGGESVRQGRPDMCLVINSHGRQDNQHVKMEGWDKKSYNMAVNVQEEKSFDENMRKKRKVEDPPKKYVADENVERVKAATEKSDTGLPASGSLQQVQKYSSDKHAGDKPERESAKQNRGEKKEDTGKMHRSYKKQESPSVNKEDDQNMPKKRYSPQTTDPKENQSKRGQEGKPKPVNYTSGKSSAEKQKRERNDGQNEIIESSPRAHAEPGTQSKEKVQPQPKRKKLRLWGGTRWNKSKKTTHSEASEKGEEESETGNRSTAKQKKTTTCCFFKSRKGNEKRK